MHFIIFHAKIISFILITKGTLKIIYYSETACHFY